jgi:membrane protein DedA with SNARE-associated domain
LRARGLNLSSVVPKSRYLLVVAVATLVVGLFEATGVVELPFGAITSGLGGSVISAASLNDFMTRYGYASLFALMTLESASLPVPSEVVLPFAGYLVYLGVMDFWTAVAVSTAASLTGALIDYYLAVWLGRPFVVELLKLFRLHRGGLDRAEGWFARSGQWTVFAARFVPGLRTVISLPAGLFKMKVWTFIVMTVAGCFSWSVVLVYAGLRAPSALNGGLASSSMVVDELAAIAAAVSALYIGYYVYLVFRGRRDRATSPLASGSSRPSP